MKPIITTSTWKLFVALITFAAAPAFPQEEATPLLSEPRAVSLNGGDLRGIINRIDYIKALGTTAIWLTPSFKNRPVQPQDGSAGYHGYWIIDFSQIDPHLGTNAELAELVDKAHRAGMKVFFDIITTEIPLPGLLSVCRQGELFPEFVRSFHVRRGRDHYELRPLQRCRRDRPFSVGLTAQLPQRP